MPTPQTLSDFTDLLTLLMDRGFDFVVIGGCAVGAYAHLREETVFSADLDLYTTMEILEEMLSWAPRHGLAVQQRPQARSLPVAVLRWRGHEVNILTWATGLPAYGLVARTARELELPGGLVVPLADPLDILANKLKAGRPKDRPHIELLCRFIEEEVVAAFSMEQGRRRIWTARRYLEVLEGRTLPIALAERLVGLAREPIDFSFLASKVPTAALAHVLRQRCAASALDSDEQDRVLHILDARGL